MYILKHGVKKDPVGRWALRDRIFFGHGACHILAGVFLREPPVPGCHAERIIPAEGFAGAHVYVTDGTMAFDYHGYSLRRRLLAHHAKGWSRQREGWSCVVSVVDSVSSQCDPEGAAVHRQDRSYEVNGQGHGMRKGATSRRTGIR